MSIPRHEITCRDCGKHWPGHSSRLGHCAACHETFSGERAFDRHRHDAATGRACRVLENNPPTPTSGGFLKDENGYWHYADKTTAKTWREWLHERRHKLDELYSK